MITTDEFSNDYFKLFNYNITQNTKLLLIKNADDLLNIPYPVILASDYAKFSKTGNRTDFEDIYFTRRRMLNSFILAELAEKKGRYLDRIIDGIFLLCEESGWQLPPHNSYGDGLGNQPYADMTRPVLDLFSCETGALLALAGYLLKDTFDEISPIICERIRHEVTSKILMPYINTHVWWMGNGTDKTCNWTPWCTQNVLISAICTDIPADTLDFIKSKALKSLTYFFNDYGYDGCCDEGALYYRHAGLCLWLSLEILKSQNVDLKFFFDNDMFSADTYTESEDAYKSYNFRKLRNMAEYILNVHAFGDYYINFADCAPNPGPCSAREFLFGKLVGSDELCKFAAEDFCNNADYLMTEEINLLYRYITILKEEEIRKYFDDISKNNFCDTSNELQKNSDIKHIWYESTGLSLYKNNSFCLAVKGGCNNDSHNHNDTGSITLYSKGQPCLIDLGVESYTAKTFSSDRYSIWTMQSSYHNLPEINGFGQMAGPEYMATNVNISSNSISMDIAGAYDIHSGISSLTRKVDITDNEIILYDVFTFKEDYTNTSTPDNEFPDNEFFNDEFSIVENFMTYSKPEWSDGVLKIGNLAVMEVPNYNDCYIEEIPINDERLKKAYQGSVYRIRFTISNLEFCTKIIIL